MNNQINVIAYTCKIAYDINHTPLDDNLKKLTHLAVHDNYHVLDNISEIYHVTGNNRPAYSQKIFKIPSMQYLICVVWLKQLKN